MRQRFATPLALAATAVLTLAACGGDDDDAAEPVATAPSASPSASPAASPTEPAPTPTEPSTTPLGTSPAEPSGDAVVALASTSLGDVLVDQAGLTLYGFMPDTEGVTTCYDDCAAAWPPVLVDAGTELAVGDGLDASMFTTAARDDTEQVQVVFGGWPLYTFAGDRAAGDVNGQGVNDVWFVVAPDGQLVTSPAGFTTEPEPEQGYGY